MLPARHDDDDVFMSFSVLRREAVPQSAIFFIFHIE